ncbi:hypothetical protein Pmani_001103 [Petrolisthes manimaculis]|uniref:Uncharacterized protein n=1 Tax=Petrolisthes manimaculis TaxID=1843537 RepID=A0AAE1USC8_9EUCA|nr:hypothetical protein Pmani_001103 [Petrolisthes manimaculis]
MKTSLNIEDPVRQGKRSDNKIQGNKMKGEYCTHRLRQYISWTSTWRSLPPQLRRIYSITPRDGNHRYGCAATGAVGESGLFFVRGSRLACFTSLAAGADDPLQSSRRH